MSKISELERANLYWPQKLLMPASPPYNVNVSVNSDVITLSVVELETARVVFSSSGTPLIAALVHEHAAKAVE